MEASSHHRVLALAALLQCASLVKELAWHGHCDEHELTILLGSLFAFDTSNVVDIYQGEANLRSGLQRVETQFSSGSHPADLELTRYAVGLLFLERKFQAKSDHLQALGEGLRAAERQVEYFHLTHESVVARLAELYQETISSLGPRILVQGEQAHLSNPNTAARIRALLLAGIRAAVLWRQNGGSRWKLLFSRKRLASEAKDLLHRLNT